MKNDKSKEEKKNLHAGHRERMREKFDKYGIDVFADHEILEILLYSVYTRQNTNEIAHRLIDTFGSLQGVMNAEHKELMKVRGVGPQAANVIKLQYGIMRAYHQSRKRMSGIKLDSVNINEYVSTLFTDNIPRMYMILMNSSRTIIAVEKIYEGGADFSVDLKPFISSAMKFNARIVLLVHNYSRTSNIPHDSDCILTEWMNSLFMLLGIKLWDYLIYANGGLISTKQHLQEHNVEKENNSMNR